MQQQAAGRLSLPTRILLGLVLGAAAGTTLNLLLAPAKGVESVAYDRLQWVANNVANPVGQVFLRLLFMVVVPLVFCSLVCGVAGIGDLRRLGRIGRRTILWFLGTTALATCLGLLLVNAFEPGKSLDAQTALEVKTLFASKAKETMDNAARGTGFGIDTFLSIIPKNVVAAAADPSAALGVIFFALMIGIAVTRLPAERTRVFVDFLQTFYDACVEVLGFAMRLAPYGVFGLVFAVTAKLGLPVIAALGYYVVVAMAGLLLHQFVVLPLLAYGLVGLTPRMFLGRARGLLVTAFSTSSSNATLPTTIRTAVDEFGVPPSVANFVLPLGATMNMNGTALFEGVAVLFLAQVAGVELPLVSQAIVIALAVLTAIGTAGVPGGSLPLLTIVLSQVGVPPDMIGLIIGVDRLVDMTRTMPNVSSDLLCSVWITKKEARDVSRQ
jgi:DAACS family dicarboxylate/amino acid:cation (Na+ or H+) symporter